MVQSDEIKKELYQNLGKLFYAVAMADKNVRPIEVEKLRESIKEHWLELDEAEDEFGTDASYQIEIVFHWLQEEEKDGKMYFEEFQDYYKDHKGFFTPEIKSLIWKTADKIAYAFAGKNKSELILLNKLKLLFGWYNF